MQVQQNKSSPLYWLIFKTLHLQAGRKLLRRKWQMKNSRNSLGSDIIFIRMFSVYSYWVYSLLSAKKLFTTWVHLESHEAQFLYNYPDCCEIWVSAYMVNIPYCLATTQVPQIHACLCSSIWLHYLSLFCGLDHLHIAQSCHHIIFRKNVSQGMYTWDCIWSYYL